jgi:hypothetical protein
MPTGQSELFAAAAVGDAPALRALLGAPGCAAGLWRSLDATGRTAGEVALAHGHQRCFDELVRQGAAAEIASRGGVAAAAAATTTNGDYLAQKLRYG